MNTLAEEKLFYERFWALLGDRVLMRVFERYGPPAFRRSSVLEGFEAFVRKHEFSGRRCVEIGTLKGLTAIVLARYFDEVVSIDIADDEQKYEIREFLGAHNVHYLTVKDNDAKAVAINALEFDAAYVDGNHTEDTDSDFALVRRCGRVLFHEHWPAQPPVVRLVATLGNTVTRDKWALWTA